MFTLVTPNSFLRRARKFFRKHPDLKSDFSQIADDLIKDPFQPHLDLHPLRGKLEGLQAVTLTHSYRIILTLKVTEKEIILLDIGNHVEVYKQRPFR